MHTLGILGLLLLFGHASALGEGTERSSLALASRAFITLCDKDKSGTVNGAELADCMDALVEAGSDKLNSRSSPTLFLRAVDVNEDGEVSMAEYEAMLEEVRRRRGGGEGGEGEHAAATFTARDGTTRKLSRREFEEMARHRPEVPDLGMEKEKRRTLEELAKEDPELAKFIAVVRWTMDSLRTRGSVIGELVQATSLPAGGSNFRDKGDGEDKTTQGIDWSALTHADFWIEFSTTESNGHRAYFEAYLERNPAIYRRPYLALKGAWELNEQGKRVRELPLPRPRLSRRPVPHGQINDDEGEFVWAAMLPVFGIIMLAIYSLRGFISEWMHVREIKRELAKNKKND